MLNVIFCTLHGTPLMKSSVTTSRILCIKIIDSNHCGYNNDPLTTNNIYPGIFSLILGCIYITAKAIFFFDLLPLTHRCSINTHIGNNATDQMRCRFSSDINAPLSGTQTSLDYCLNTANLYQSYAESKWF